MWNFSSQLTLGPKPHCFKEVTTFTSFLFNWQPKRCAKIQKHWSVWKFSRSFLMAVKTLSEHESTNIKANTGEENIQWTLLHLWIIAHHCGSSGKSFPAFPVPGLCVYSLFFIGALWSLLMSDKSLLSRTCSAAPRIYAALSTCQRVCPTCYTGSKKRETRLLTDSLHSTWRCRTERCHATLCASLVHELQTELQTNKHNT